MHFNIVYVYWFVVNECACIGVEEVLIQINPLAVHENCLTFHNYTRSLYVTCDDTGDVPAERLVDDSVRRLAFLQVQQNLLG